MIGYAINTRSGVWHAFASPAADLSVCELFEQPARAREHVREMPRRVCQICRARLRCRSRSAPRPVPHRPDASVCACEECRAERHASVGAYLMETSDQLDARFGWARQWPGAVEYVRGAESALGAVLMLWERSGLPREHLRDELADAQRELFGAWERAARAYDLFGGPRAGGR